MHTESFNLRPYQNEAVDNIQKALDVQSNVCVQLASGTGKGVVVRELITRMREHRKLRILILTEMKQVALQLYNMFEDSTSIPISLIETTYDTDWPNIDICTSTVQLLIGGSDLIIKHFDIVIFYDVSAKRITPIVELAIGKKELKLIYVTSYLSIQDVELFGGPVFSYSIADAMSDGIFHPVEFIVGPKVNENGFTNQKRFVEVLSRFQYDFEKEGRKVLIICKSIGEAELVLQICQNKIPLSSPVLFSSKVTDVLGKLRRFREGSDGNIGIVVNMFKELNVDQLTDVVLLRTFRSHNTFLQAISVLTRRSKSNYACRVWDYGGNRRFIDKEMGSISEDNIPFEDSDDSVYFENLVEPEGHQQTHDEVKFQDNVEETLTLSEKENLGEKIVSTIVRKLANPCDDKPTEEDLLGRSGLVNILKGIIDRDGRKHLIIALFGRWGSGKSSVINLVKEKFKNSPNNSFIVFNAWQEEHSASMAASLANKISKDLYQSKNFFK